MSPLRALAAALVVAFAVLCTPAALEPVLNSADLIVATAPVAVVALLWRRTPKTPVEAPAPRAASNRSLDGLDYPAPVPARRALADFPATEHLAPCATDCWVCEAAR